MQEIGRDEVRRLVSDEAGQLVEVLPAKEYEEEHLPGAVNLPLLGDGAASSETPDLLEGGRRPGFDNRLRQMTADVERLAEKSPGSLAVP